MEERRVHSLSVKTPGGVIRAEANPGSLFPNITIMVDGEIAAIAEYDSYSKRIRILSYIKTDDEPVNTTYWEE